MQFENEFSIQYGLMGYYAPVDLWFFKSQKVNFTYFFCSRFIFKPNFNRNRAKNMLKNDFYFNRQHFQ